MIINEELTPKEVELLLDKYIFNKKINKKQNFSSLGIGRINQKISVLKNSPYQADKHLKDANLQDINKERFLDLFTNIANKYEDKTIAIELCKNILSIFDADGNIK
mgnify:CR=1 FL=1